MGLIYGGVPTMLALRLRDTAGVGVFVETGTYRGATATWAAKQFDKVITLEASKSMYDASVLALAAIPNVELRHCDSRAGLKDVVSGLTGPSMFWLDSHWSGGETFGKEDECPLIDEIRLISGAADEHLVLIDDARLFLGPPPPPHDPDQWPDIASVIEELTVAPSRRHVTIIEDVIIAVPRRFRDTVRTYAREVADRQWTERRARAGEARWKTSASLLRSAFRALLG